MSEVQPLDMKDIGYIPGQSLEEMRDQAEDARRGRTGTATHGQIECYVYSELQERRQHFIVPKNDKDVNKLLQEHRTQYGHEYGEDNANYYFTEKDRKPVYLLGHFKGTKQELDEFVTGRQETTPEGTVMQALAAHPRTYVSGTPGAYGNPPTYELDKATVLQRIVALKIASEIRDVGEFSKLRELILKNEEDRRRA